NFVVIFRDSVNGGTVQTEAGEDTVYYCPASAGGPTSVFKFDSMMTAGTNFQYVVTDDQGIILGLPPADMVDVGPAGLGTCLVWGLSYTGSLTAQAGDDAAQVALSDGCYDLSDNFVVIFRDSVNGGSVSIMDTTATEITTCPGDGEADVVSFEADGFSRENYQYIVTDDMGMILGLPPGNSADFEGAGVGICRVYGFAYTGDLIASTGMNLNSVTASGCHDLSENFITVDRDENFCTTNVSEEALSLGLSVAPVPTRNEATIRYTAREAGLTRIKLVTLQGKEILSQETQSSVGEQELRLDLQGLPNGIYLIQVRSGQQQAWTRLIKE
ncbi:MAG: T9SS type A sorting domain-containing protein, partial [Bacteroidota bacterium]